ncbi:MAG: EAL domain-containing protein [Deltaproteobacteria bacterium]|nr:EAL domain-containing protein [Deltaproteobacteria bacterium]
MKKTLQRIVLVVKDESVSDQIAQSINQDGIEIVTCEESEAVEALLSQGPIDILIMDLPLAIPLAQHISSNYSETVLVGLSENCPPSLVQEAEKAGVPIILERLELETQLHPTQGSPVQHFERLEDFLAKNKADALLQPIIKLKNPKEFLGLESLARPPSHLPLWNAQTLFAYAARKEYLLETDLFCLRAAFHEARAISGLQKLFVNLRPRSVTHPHFVQKLLDLSQEAQIKPQNLVFELTEQQSILNLKVFLENLDYLRSLGFEIALDDFGTGFANLQWLYDIKPNYLKIAGVFCRNLESDKTKQVLLEATTEIAHQLKIPTVLENIETKAEFEAAKRIGIDFGQGYYFCKPTPAKELIPILAGYTQLSSI